MCEEILTFRCGKCFLSISPSPTFYYSCPSCGERTNIEHVSVPVPEIPDCMITELPSGNESRISDNPDPKVTDREHQPEYPEDAA